MERQSYTITNLEISEDGTMKVSIEYDLFNNKYNDELPVFFSAPSNIIDPVALNKLVLEYVDQSIQNRINTHKTKIERKAFADMAKNQFSSLIGAKVDLTEEELKVKIAELASKNDIIN